MSKKKTESEQPQLRSFPMNFSKIETDLMQLIQYDELAETLIETYGLSLIMSLLFPEDSLGENFNNIWTQINRVCQRFEVDVSAWQQDLGILLGKWQPTVDAQKREMTKKAIESLKETGGLSPQ